MVAAGGDESDSRLPPSTSARPRASDERASGRLDTPLDALDHVAAWVERPITRVAGSHRLNPLPHAGTITVFLLGVVILSGLYITLFFEFGFEASYNSVAKMDEHAIQKVVRALHRYSSAVLVFTTLVHAWRIAAARRFVGRVRRWRWATGVASLVTVWLAGVTGYWLVWDIRAQGLTEATIALTGWTRWGASFAVNRLLVADSTGSGVLLAIWFAHLGLTAVIGYFAYRHLRRSQLAWLPPRHWMFLMGGALVFVSLLLPVGMLGPADNGRLVGDVPLDPFVLFLLPPLLSSWRWLAVIVLVVAVLVVLAFPRLLRRSDPAAVIIDEEACTGCELCVVDCPYLALEMTAFGMTALDMTQPGEGNAIAVVDESRCVGCGICLGSCSFGAMSLPDEPEFATIEPAGRPVVIACDRHLDAGDGPGRDSDSAGSDGSLIVPVRCAGMFNPRAVGELVEAGAPSVQLVGCAPADCRYGTGNTIASERLSGERSPHVPRRWSGQVLEDWVAPGRLDASVAAPGNHPSADAASAPGGRDRLVGAAFVVGLSVLATGLATRAPFRGDDQAAVRVVVEHEAGEQLEGIDEPLGGLGEPVTVIVVIDGETAAERAFPGGDPAVGIIDVELEPGDEPSLIEVSLADGPDRVTLLSDTVQLADGQRLVVEARDVPPPPGPTEGERVFNARELGACNVCHSVEPDDDGVGPSLAGVATVGTDRVAGLDAEGYLRQSILLPDQYVVDGYPAGQMLPIYRDRLSAAELESLITYLLTLESEDGDS